MHTFFQNLLTKKSLYISSTLLTLVSILSLIQIFTGIFGQAKYCAENVNPCTPWRSYLYLSYSASHPAPLDDNLLAQIFLKEKERFFLDQTNNIFVTKIVEKYKGELQKKETQAALITSFGEEATVTALRKKGEISEEESSILGLLAYNTIARDFKNYLENSKNALIEKNVKTLTKIMPTNVNLNDYVRFFDRLQESISTPQKPFVFQNISVKEGKDTEDFYDTVEISFLLTTTQDTLKEFLKAIYNSGNLPLLSPENSPLYPFLEIQQAKITFPELQETKNENTNMKAPTYTVEMQLIAYIKAVSDVTVQTLQKEIEELNTKITTVEKNTLLTEEKRIKKENLVQYRDGYMTEAKTALQNKNFRQAYSALQNVKELSTELYELYL